MKISMLAAASAELFDNIGTKAESYGRFLRGLFSDGFVIILVSAIILAVLLVWAKYLRKRRKRVAGGEKVYRPRPNPETEEAVSRESRRRYKRRVRRRRHRQRNPTVAETGGLPSVRAEHKPDSSV